MIYDHPVLVSSMVSRVPRLAVTMGDPGGIGPEVVVKALADPELRGRADIRIIGIDRCLRDASRAAGIEPYWSSTKPGSTDTSALPGMRSVRVVEVGPSPTDPFPPESTAAAGQCSFRFVDHAISAAMLHEKDPSCVDAVVTAPISKEAWSMAGHGRYPGHTELFAERFGVPDAGMLFHVPARAPWSALNVILATVHVPLMSVPSMLAPALVLRKIEQGHGFCRRLGVSNPRAAVCGLNPHAGEHGVLGTDEARAIVPAIQAARARGMDVRGPFPGDTVFNAAFGGGFDLVVAMYHDQGLIPVKLVARERAVNVTVGLPIVRTSPDHGTAFDIAGTSRADAGSMRAAIELAVSLCAGESI